MEERQRPEELKDPDKDEMIETGEPDEPIENGEPDTDDPIETGEPDTDEPIETGEPEKPNIEEMDRPEDEVAEEPQDPEEPEEVTEEIPQEPAEQITESTDTDTIESPSWKEKLLSYMGFDGILCVCLLAFQVITGIFLIWELASLNVIPPRFLWMLGAGLGAAAVLAAGLLATRKRAAQGIAVVLGVVLGVGSLVGSLYAGQTREALSAITSEENLEDMDEMVIAVLSDSQYQDTADLKWRAIGVLKNLDREHADATVTTLSEEWGTQAVCTEYEDVSGLIQGLYDREVEAVIYNNLYRDMIEESFEDYAEDARVLRSFYYEIPVEAEETEPETEPDPHAQVTENQKLREEAFTVYMSGIDTYGKLSKKSRSDVNLIATVNPVTRRILIVTTPRDYYVQLAIEGEPWDKLTHAGIYGIDCSRETLENLYDIKIDYYVRVNFSGFMDIVDALNGVDVYSEQEFTGEVGHFTYQKGINHVNGKMALGFVRERHSFADGDYQRARNQMAMLKAIVDKLTSPAILTSYSGVLKTMRKSVNTDFSMDDIGTLINLQLDDNRPWTLETVSTGGTDARKTTYSMGSRSLFVVLPEEEEIAESARRMQEVRDGVTVEETTESVSESEETEEENLSETGTIQETEERPEDGSETEETE